MRRFCLREGGEADVPLCLEGGYHLCGIRLLLEDFCPGDTAVLRSCTGCGCWSRQLLCQGEIRFGFLAPGQYALTLYRGKTCLPLAVWLPPGGNVEIFCRLDRIRCRWRQDLWHYFFNTW